MGITIFNFFNYLDNPIADFCVSKYEHKTIYTLDDLMPEIQKLKHSKWALENNKRSYIGDQLRLYLASKQDKFLYVDADCFIPDFSKILENKNCTEYEPNGRIINNGTFFYSDSNCKFNNYYLEIYDKLPEHLNKNCNYEIFRMFPYELDLEKRLSGDMKLLTLENKHFLLNLFYRFKDRHPGVDTIYYSRKSIPEIKHPLVWKIEDCDPYVGVGHLPTKEIWYFETIYKFIPQDDIIRLFKEQMNYTFQKKLKFVEV